MMKTNKMKSMDMSMFTSFEGLKDLHKEMKAKQILSDEDIKRVKGFIKDMKHSGNVARFSYKDSKYYFGDDSDVDPKFLVDVNDLVGVRNVLDLLMEDRGARVLMISYPLREEEVDILKNLKFIDGKNLTFKTVELNARGFWSVASDPKKDVEPDNSTEKVEMKDGSIKEVPVRLYRFFRSIIANKLNIPIKEVQLKKAKPMQKKSSKNKKK